MKKSKKLWIPVLTLITTSAIAAAAGTGSQGTRERGGTTSSTTSRPGTSGNTTTGRPGMHGGGMMNMTMTPEARKEMSQMMREMADCLDEGTEWVQCHQRVHQGRRFRISVEPEGRTGENQQPGRTGTDRSNESRTKTEKEYRERERR